MKTGFFNQHPYIVDGNLQQRDPSQAVRLYEQGANKGTGKPVMWSSRRWRVSRSAVAFLALGSGIFLTPWMPTHAIVTAQTTSCTVTNGNTTCDVSGDQLFFLCEPSSCPLFDPAIGLWGPTGLPGGVCTAHSVGLDVSTGFLIDIGSPCGSGIHVADGTYYYAMKNLSTYQLGWFEIEINGNTATITKTAYDDTVNSSIKVGYADTPTFVNLVGFDCQITASTSECQWSVGMEIESTGYNLWRQNNATWEVVNSNIVPATGDGSTYVVSDTRGGSNKGFSYRLEEIDQHGGSTFFAPHGSDTPTEAPLRVVANSPDNGETLNTDTPPTFAWAADHATTFNLQYAIGDTRTIYNVYPSSGTTNTRYTPAADVWLAFGALTSPQTIYWRVVMQHTNGKVFYTPVRQFTVSH